MWYQTFDGAENHADCNLQEKDNCYNLTVGVDRIYNLACNMGGMGFIENNKAECMLSVLINTNLLRACLVNEVKKYFYSSSACVYNGTKQKETFVPGLKEDDAYPADPEDGYGWEKLFSEIITQYGAKEHNINARIARFHNCYGPYGTWQGGREKAPAALCRKIIEAQKANKHEIDVWGDGEQTRSFMYIDDCIEGINRLWESDYIDPVNLGSSELVSINQMIDMIEEIAGIKVKRNYQLDKPQGVRGRNSDNSLIKKVTGGWEPSVKLFHGL